MTPELEGKIAIVTGAGKGLGLAIATRFAEEGAAVVVSDIDGDAAQVAADKLPGGRHLAITCDVRDEQQVQELIDRTVSDMGGLHVMVPNAGVGHPCPILGMDLTAWRAVVSVNLDGVFLCVRYAAPAIIASGGGSIVNIASVTGTAGSPLMCHYAAAKAAVINLTKTAAVELRPHGVRVNAVLPGFVGTELVTSAAPLFEQTLGLPAGGFDDLIVQKQGRYGTPEEVTEAVLLFAGDRSRFCTGSELVLDGGLTGSLF